MHVCVGVGVCVNDGVGVDMLWVNIKTCTLSPPIRNIYRLLKATEYNGQQLRANWKHLGH